MNDNKEWTCTHDVYDACMYKALESHMMKENGCVAPYVISDQQVFISLSMFLKCYN